MNGTNGNDDIKDSPAPAEPSVPTRGPLHVSDDGGSNVVAGPHTADGAGDDGQHIRQRVLAVKLDFKDAPEIWQELKDLSWQAAGYRNRMLRGRWAETQHFKKDPTKDVPHDITKWIRAYEKGDLSGAAYSAAEQEVQAVWTRHAKRILAGAPLPEWKPTAALSIRGHKKRNESGIRLSLDGQGRFVAELNVWGVKTERAQKHPDGCWIKAPIAAGTVKDYQADMLRKMVSGEMPISKATVVLKTGRRAAILRMSYALEIPLPSFGNRIATLGPITDRGGLFLRTECDTRDFTGRLHTIVVRKHDWDLIRRRVMAQIGRHKGSARTKRKVLARMSWENWLDTFLHTWSRDIINWLKTQGMCRLDVTGLENVDWPIFKFVERLRYKGEAVGITVNTEIDLADAASERAVKRVVHQRRARATKMGKAIREIEHQQGAVGTAGAKLTS